MIAASQVPVELDADEALDRMLAELAKPAYQAAQPTLFDRVAQAIRDWFASLQLTGDGPPTLGIVIVVVLVAVALVVAFLIFGLPRLNRRSAAVGSLFGDDDARTAEQLRASAATAAAAGDHATAIAERFRAIARDLAERTVVTVTPGTTARDFAQRAAAAFPEQLDGLAAAATAFDDVRYLGGTGDRARYEQVAAVDEALRAARPRLQPVPA